MFRERVYRWLPAKSEVNVRYMILLFRVPKDFRGVKSASAGGGKAVVIENGPSPRKLASRVKNFL
ncbi:MAG: hypothetical protein WCA98_07740 [Candidatus Acidiferrales bacterium]